MSKQSKIESKKENNQINIRPPKSILDWLEEKVQAKEGAITRQDVILDCLIQIKQAEADASQ